MDEAVREARRARELDPLSLTINGNSARTLFLAGRPEEAIPEMRNVVAMDTTFPLTNEFLGTAYLAQRHYAEAVPILRRAVDPALRQAMPLAVLGYALAKSGRRGGGPTDSRGAARPAAARLRLAGEPRGARRRARRHGGDVRLARAGNRGARSVPALQLRERSGSWRRSGGTRGGRRSCGRWGWSSGSGGVGGWSSGSGGVGDCCEGAGRVLGAGRAPVVRGPSGRSPRRSTASSREHRPAPPV